MERELSTSTYIRAHRYLIAWNAPMGRSNSMRSLMWKTRIFYEDFGDPIAAFSLTLNLEPFTLAPICSNHIMFAHDLCHSQIEYFKEFFKFLKNLSKK